MKRVLLALALSATPAIADMDGADILPFTVPGGMITGTVTVYPDGTATVSGWIKDAPFASWGKATRDSDGHFHFNPLLTDGDKLISKKLWVPITIDFWGTDEDADDGDDSDDDVGSITVKSQTGVGTGSVQLSG